VTSDTKLFSHLFAKDSNRVFLGSLSSRMASQMRRVKR
jgi:hypothetical protein